MQGLFFFSARVILKCFYWAWLPDYTVGLHTKPTWSKLWSHQYMSNIPPVHFWTATVSSITLDSQCKIGVDRWEQSGVDSCLLHYYTLYLSAAWVCTRLNIQDSMRFECVYVYVCFFALSCRHLSHTVISPARGHECWPSFCGQRRWPKSYLSLCLIVFLSYLFSYLLLIVRVIVHLMALSGTYYLLGCPFSQSLWIGFTVGNLTLSYPIV